MGLQPLLQVGGARKPPEHGKQPHQPDGGEEGKEAAAVLDKYRDRWCTADSTGRIIVEYKPGPPAPVAFSG